MIYLDNNATTMIDPEVAKEMFALYDQILLGNPSSTHRFGQKAKGILNHSLNQIAQFFHVNPEELIFTSGATEALNMMIQGMKINGRHIISSAFEHPSVLQPLKLQETKGFTVSYLNPISGRISRQDVEEAVRTDTGLIVLMAVNNETGIKNEIYDIADFAYEKNIPFLVDGVALLGKENFDIPKGVSAICFSSHKIHGPLGCGLVIVKKGVKFAPLILGGPQQHGKRGGTENVAAIVGFAKAIALLKKHLPEATLRMQNLRNRLEESLLSLIPDLTIHGKHVERICNVSNMSFPQIDGETLLMHLDLEKVAVSHGSACSSGGLEPSHVLLNMQIPPKLAASSIRFSLSRFTTFEDIDQTIKILELYQSSQKNLIWADAKAFAIQRS